MRLMACFGVVVLLVILDSLSKALATAEETKRSNWLQEPGTQYNIGGPPLDRDLRSGPGSPKAFGRIPRVNVQSFGRIPRMNVQSFGRIPRTNMQSFGRIPRTNIQSFGRIPRTNLQSFGRIPRTEGDSDNKAEDKFLEEMSRRAWGARLAPGTSIGKREWEKEDNFAFKRTDENQALLDAMLDVFDARNTYNNNED